MSLNFLKDLFEITFLAIPSLYEFITEATVYTLYKCFLKKFHKIHKNIRVRASETLWQVFSCENSKFAEELFCRTPSIIIKPFVLIPNFQCNKKIKYRICSHHCICQHLKNVSGLLGGFHIFLAFQNDVRKFGHRRVYGKNLYLFHTDLFLYPHENIKKALVFWHFQVVQKDLWHGLAEACFFSTSIEKNSRKINEITQNIQERTKWNFGRQPLKNDAVFNKFHLVNS